MIRRIIEIDQDKCNGCEACVNACHEGAIGMVDGKAKLLRDDYCDGLGDCLPECPTGAITFIEREAKAYDHEAVKENIKNKNKIAAEQAAPFQLKSQPDEGLQLKSQTSEVFQLKPQPASLKVESHLSNWPVQIKLAPVSAPYFDNASLLIGADCTAFAYGDFHRDFMAGNVTLIGCPKLDNEDYSRKLAAIIKNNNIRSIKVARMQVPCCGGLEMAVKRALAESGKDIPLEVKVISRDGKLLG